MADSKSDIDILVDLDYSQRIGLQFIQMKLDLERLLDAKVDLVSSNGMSKYIKTLVDGEQTFDICEVNSVIKLDCNIFSKQLTKYRNV